MNGGKNDGLQIRAAFAHQKREENPVQIVAQKAPVKTVKEEEETVIRLPMTVNFDVEVDDVHERVTAFHRKKDLLKTFEAFKQREMSIKLAKQSKGSYNEHDVSFMECFEEFNV